MTDADSFLMSNKWHRTVCTASTVSAAQAYDGLIYFMISWIIHVLWLVLISKCGKYIHGTLYCTSCTTFLFFTHFDVNYDLLLNSIVSEHLQLLEWNLTRIQNILELSCNEVQHIWINYHRLYDKLNYTCTLIGSYIKMW